jgi:rod shape-determining protein MreD
MRLFDRINIDRSTLLRFSIYLILAIAFAFLNSSVLSFIKIGEIMPDLVLLLVIYISIREGQFKGLFAGFAAGLILDIVSLDVLGTNALAKTVAAFIAGFFYRENKFRQIVGNIGFLTIVFLSAAIHNLIYYFFYIKVSELDFLNFFLKYGFATSLYTTVLSVFIMLLNFKRREINV